MKVCTDACLFGALVANSILSTNKKKDSLQCLDIGTGTGLLSMMAVQKNNEIHIDAIEIDASAAEQATENITISPWAGRIQVFKEDMLTFRAANKYDYIFSNPPFFEGDLKSALKAKNDAKHDTSMSLLELLHLVANHLTTTGYFAVLLPYQRVDYFIEESKKNGLHLTQQILVKQTIKHKFFRGILFFNRKQTEPELSEIIIKDTANNYTPEFSTALKDYYLFL